MFLRRVESEIEMVDPEEKMENRLTVISRGNDLNLYYDCLFSIFIVNGVSFVGNLSPRAAQINLSSASNVCFLFF